LSGRIDWTALIGVGMGRLSLAPDAFWAMSPVELRAALGSLASSPEPLGRSGLAALMAAHPDRGEGER
jgi:uncharacterized phage protein (TIGR02216 family)